MRHSASPCPAIKVRVRRSPIGSSLRSIYSYEGCLHQWTFTNASRLPFRHFDESPVCAFSARWRQRGNYFHRGGHAAEFGSDRSSPTDVEDCQDRRQTTFAKLDLRAVNVETKCDKVARFLGILALQTFLGCCQDEYGELVWRNGGFERSERSEERDERVLMPCAG